MPAKRYCANSTNSKLSNPMGHFWSSEIGDLESQKDLLPVLTTADDLGSEEFWDTLPASCVFIYEN